MRFATLENNISSKIVLRIFCGEKESDKELIILDADCNRTGFISGTNWNTKTIDVDKEKGRNFCRYNVSGIMEWKILGLTIYSEAKDFSGNALLRK